MGVLSVVRYRGRVADPISLQRALACAEDRVSALKAQLAQLCGPERPLTPLPRPIRIWMDGAFDMMHYGHANAFRQGRALGTHLVVGVNDDASISACKGPPLMDDAERLEMVRSCKWVDEVVPHVPYVMSDEYVRWVIETYRIDYVVHGDDPCIVEGRDVYESAQKIGKYRTIPRTEGVSTTEIVGRMLQITEDPAPRRLNFFSRAPQPALYVPRESKFMTTSVMLNRFADGTRPPPTGARVVFVSGAWDMFHAGHVAFLEAARALGDYLLVGVHNDAIVNRRRRNQFPVMNLNERTLSVLSCRHVDDVLIDPPLNLTREMIASLKIATVVHGTGHDDTHTIDASDPYEVPKEMGIFVKLPQQRPLNVQCVVERIRLNHERLASKVKRKAVAEQEYYTNRYGF